MHSLTRHLVIATACVTLGTPVLSAQDAPGPDIKVQAQRIAQERPREAEAAARAFLHHVANDRVGALDSLKARSLDEYWMEVGQLTAQFGMVQELVRRDSARAEVVAQMFGVEVHARSQQRAYRDASEAQRPQIRRQLDALIGRHFELEDRLRALEIADIERRLVQVRAETQRRRDKRAEFVKWAVDDIIRDATRPR